MTGEMAVMESPCVRECVIDAASGYCRGCWRTLDEISFWARYTPEEKMRVLGRLQTRRTVAAGAGASD